MKDGNKNKVLNKLLSAAPQDRLKGSLTNWKASESFGSICTTNGCILQEELFMLSFIASVSVFPEVCLHFVDAVVLCQWRSLWVCLSLYLCVSYDETLIQLHKTLNIFPPTCTIQSLSFQILYTTVAMIRGLHSRRLQPPNGDIKLRDALIDRWWSESPIFSLIGHDQLPADQSQI